MLNFVTPTKLKKLKNGMHQDDLNKKSSVEK